MTTSLVRASRATAPAWVRVSLWKLDDRRSAQAFLLLSVALGLVGVGAGLAVSPVYFGALGFWAAVPWYARAIRWMDDHEAWG